MIKPFQPQYLDAVMHIWLNTNLSAHAFVDKAYWQNAAETVRSLLPESDLFVYLEETIVKGFIGITDGGYIAGLFVKEEFQAQGIGQGLLAHCMQRYSRLELDVFIENETAVRFYRKNGFTAVATKMNPEFGHMESHMVWVAGEDASRKILA